MASPTRQFAGIVNVTDDSFSDGGLFVTTEAAVARAEQLIADGANVLDLGAESTHPDAADVPAGAEIDRLLPVIERLVSRIPVSVDTWKPETMRRVLAAGATIINDVFALRAPGAVEAVCQAPDAHVVIMYSACNAPRAFPEARPVEGLLDRTLAFFEERITTLERAGIARTRITLDPGMGFFLGAGPEASLAALRHLPELARFNCPLYVSVSRKSFLGAVTGRAIHERASATLGAELYALAHGADWIRTHDVRAIGDAWKVWSAI